MKIKELLEKLKEFPEDLEVMVHGYEGGYKNIKFLEIDNFVLNYRPKDGYYGPHELKNDTIDCLLEDKKVIKALLIN